MARMQACSFGSGVLAALALSSFGAHLAAQTSDHDHAQFNVFAQLPWQELGPVASGGRIVDFAVHPQNPRIFWVASASGGLWRSDDGGLSFTPQFQDAYSISIGDIAVAPSNGDVLYVGTGEANNQRSSYWGNGVYKSLDGGKTFTHVGLQRTEHIGRIVVHPSNPDIVYVAALGALYTPSEDRGLYRTTDGGSSWQRIHHLGPD
ncbi:MAG: glycosyl hydrolase, partial [Planctomycetes bacterium]|nr:glycosyl hydrolase [Planctomycetota bacterium]